MSLGSPSHDAHSLCKTMRAIPKGRSMRRACARQVVAFQRVGVLAFAVGGVFKDIRPLGKSGYPLKSPRWRCAGWGRHGVIVVWD